MGHEFKYELGDRVHTIGHGSERIRITCKACDGKGNLIGADKGEYYCNQCAGDGYNHEFTPSAWDINLNTLTIGQQRVQITRDRIALDEDFNSTYETVIEEEYMCQETGVGSGSVYKLAKLYPSAAAARKECKRLNEEQRRKAEALAVEGT